MPGEWPTFALIFTTAIAVVVFMVKKWIEVRLKAIDLFHKAKFDAVVQLSGLLNEIDHSVSHLRSGDEDYADVLEQHCGDVRRESRARSALLPESLVAAIKSATDTARRYSKDRDEDSHDLWKRRLERLNRRCDDLIRTVDLNPRRSGRD